MLFPWQKKWPTAPLQNPRNTVLTNQEDPMWRVRRDIQHPDVRILPRAQSNPIIPGANRVPTGGNVFANMFPDKDEDFWEKLKEQLGEAGADFDKADQPFKSLSPVSVPGARHQPAQIQSMLTTKGTPTGGSYNPYLGDPAKRKRPR